MASLVNSTDFRQGKSDKTVLSNKVILQIKMTGEESSVSSTIETCPYYRVGFCKYKEKCRLYHPKENCGERKCSIRTCNKRHKKPCKYGQVCTRIDYCEFLHHHKEKHIENIPESTDYKNEAEELGKKVTTLKAEIDLLKANVERQKEELKSIQNESNKKLDRFKNKQLEKENVDKDTLIKVLRGKLKDKVQIIEEQKDKVTRLMQDKLENGKELNLLKEEAKLKKTDSVKCKLISNKVVVTKTASTQPTLPGAIPDRSTTLAGGATVICLTNV